jgi:uncharacterized membrane protein YuzA (DUF378 family)
MGQSLIIHIALFIVLLGAINWGLIAVNGQWNVAKFVQNDNARRAIYAIIGLAGVMVLGHWLMTPSSLSGDQ